MAILSTIPSNVTGLRISQETALKTAGSVWYPQEPTSYADFGAKYAMQAPRPINDTRRLKKGNILDLDAVANFSMYVSPINLCNGVGLAQGFMYSAFTAKDELAVADVNTTLDDFQPASGGDAYVANDLLWAEGFDDAVNNGVHVVTGAPAAASIPVTTNLTTATTQSGTVRRVGFIFAAGDAEIDASGTLPVLTTTTKDMTAFDVIAGEWVYIGGDTAASAFETAANNGFKRVGATPTANAMTFDKSFTTMVTETDGDNSQSIRIVFSGRILKDQSSGANRTRYSYQQERQLGAPDDASPSDIQAQYVRGCVANTLTLNIPVADFVTADLEFVACDEELYAAATPLKAGTRPAQVSHDFFNTSDSFKRIKLAVIDTTDENPSSLLAGTATAYLSDLTLTITNNVTPLKAVGTTGAFDLNTGAFEVTAAGTGYFADIAALSAIAANSDCTLDAILVNGAAGAKRGVVLDVPLLGVGDGSLAVEQDAPVSVALEMAAGDGTQFDATFDHTLLLQFFDYLPDAADA